MKYNLFIFLVTFFTVCQTSAVERAKNTEGVFNKKTSSVFLVQNDSLIKSKYDKLYKLYKKNNYAQALEGALKFHDECKKENNSYWTYKALSLLAEIYNKTNKYKESLNYYKESLEYINLSLDEEKDSRFTKVDFYYIILHIGSLYQKLSISKEENNKFSYLDSAKYYYREIEKSPALNTIIDGYKASAFTNLSGIYEQDSVYDKAEMYARKSIEIHKKNNDNLSRAFSLNNLGNIYLSQQKYEKSKEIYFEALDLVKNNTNTRAIRLKASLFFNLAWAMRNLKDYKAYDFQEEYYNIEDTIRQKEFSGIIEEITHKYNLDTELELIKKDQNIKLLEQKDKVNTIVVISILILIMLLLIIAYYNIRQKNLLIQLTKTELLQTQNLEKLKSDSQVRILNATIDGKESERKEIAETLHDSVSALLSSANLHLQASRKQFEGEVPLEIDKSQKIINEASDKIRDLSHSLMSSVLLKFGLNFAIKDIAEKYSNSELSIDTQISQLRRYDQNFEIKTHNIIQEFVNNILKHSKAENAFIKLKEADGSLILVISDDGIGFNKKKAVTKDGLGLNQIDARIKMMKGKFKIITSKNNGTVIKVELPILEREFN